MQTLYIEAREIRSAGMPREAFFIVDQDGKAISQPYPTRYVANRQRELYAADFSDVQIGIRKRPR